MDNGSMKKCRCIKNFQSKFNIGHIYDYEEMWGWWDYRVKYDSLFDLKFTWFDFSDYFEKIEEYNEEIEWIMEVDKESAQ